jgi:hypothetical protein
MTRVLNDRLRIEGATPDLGRIMMTNRVMGMNPDLFLDLITELRNYTFTEECEHDYGAIKLGNQTYKWKIDYYDNTYSYGASYDKRNNTDECKRVLTIMHSDEY